MSSPRQRQFCPGDRRFVEDMVAEAIKLRRPTAGVKSTFAGLLHQFLLLHQPAKVLLKRPCRCSRQRRPRQRIAIGEKPTTLLMTNVTIRGFREECALRPDGWSGLAGPGGRAVEDAASRAALAEDDIGRDSRAGSLAPCLHESIGRIPASSQWSGSSVIEPW